MDSAVDAVFLGAATAAALSLLVLLFLAPRRFPVHQDPSPDPAPGPQPHKATDPATDPATGAS